MGRCLAAASHVSAKEWSSTVIRLILQPQTRQPPIVTIYSLLDTNSQPNFHLEDAYMMKIYIKSGSTSPGSPRQKPHPMESFQLDYGRLGDAGGLWMHRSGHWGTRDNNNDKFKLPIERCLSAAERVASPKCLSTNESALKKRLQYICS
jgi:hypothetical protein